MFRHWIDEVFPTLNGDLPKWPVFFGELLDVEFKRQLAIDEQYAGGHVFIERDAHVFVVGETEDRLVARLYHSVRTTNSRTIELNGQRILLLGYQWPTQGGHAGTSADLVGLKQDGGLVVFEAKVTNGRYPLHAIFQGLDYLACLLRPRNFERIVTGYRDWKNRLIDHANHPIPAEFQDVEPSRNVKPMLVVLAPNDYYTEGHARSQLSLDWIHLLGRKFMSEVDVQFATTDFTSPNLGLALSNQN